MKIRNRLSLYFTLISAGVLLVVLCTIYFAFSVFSKDEFYKKLYERAHIAALLYLEADEINADSLTRVRERYLGKLPEEIIRLYDDRNKAAFIKDKHQSWNDAIIDKVRKRDFLKYAEGDRQVTGIYYKDNQGDFVILVSAIDVDSIQKRRHIAEIMIALFILVSLGLFFAGRWFAQKALSPMNDLIHQMQHIRSTQLHIRVDEGNGKDEISELAKNFNQLLEHLENAFEVQKTFVANASHELRTPVTSITGEIEVALQKKRNEDEYRSTLQSVLVSTEQLKDTISNLMELAQVDIGLIKATLTPVSMDELVWEMQEEWINKLAENAFHVKIIQLPKDHSGLCIMANKPLLTIALNNIISNAFKFSNNQPIECSLFADGKIIRLEIKDKGIGIPSDAFQKIYTPFYRGNNADNFSGSGIGLYVTYKIFRLFNGHLSIHSIINKGTTVSIEFYTSNR